MVRKWSQSGPVEIVGREMAFFRDTTVFQQRKNGVTVRKDSPGPMDCIPEDESSILLQNVDIRLQYHTVLIQKITM
jgi:hypothetical protein